MSRGRRRDRPAAGRLAGHRLRDRAGDEALGASLVQARAILTPDHEFFDMAKLVPLMEAALEADRRGETEPLLDDEIRG